MISICVVCFFFVCVCFDVCCVCVLVFQSLRKQGFHITQDRTLYSVHCKKKQKYKQTNTNTKANTTQTLKTKQKGKYKKKKRKTCKHTVVNCDYF